MRESHVIYGVEENTSRYGDDLYDDRSVLRADVWEISGGFCEHPVKHPSWPITIRCNEGATELAHIRSIGMGGRRSADFVNNVFAACYLHARSSDDLTSDEWLVLKHVVPLDGDLLGKLAEWIRTQRLRQGWAV